MGWVNSPAFFCAATETARDLTDTAVTSEPFQNTPQPFEDEILSDTKLKFDWLDTDDSKFRHLLEVYIDDFLMLIQTRDYKRVVDITRKCLEKLHNVFTDAERNGSAMGGPIAMKKLKAEGVWEMRKEILGWFIDGVKRTIQLPEDKATKILDTLKELRRSRWIGFKDLEKLHGKLQFTAIALPVGKPLLGELDAILTHAKRHHRH